MDVAEALRQLLLSRHEGPAVSHPNPSKTRWDPCQPRPRLGPKFKGNLFAQQAGLQKSLMDMDYFTLRLAGEEGLEPPTPGFGDRCSTN